MSDDSQVNEAPRSDALEALEERNEHADGIIKKYVLAAMGCGLIPMPAVDLAAVLAMEMKRIQELATVYAFTFPSRQVFYKIAISIMGSLGPLYLSQRYGQLIKTVPLVGHVAAAALVVTNGASVYAVGKVFQKHFESGGSFLSRGKTRVRGYFEEKCEEGKQTVPRWVTA